MTTIIPPSRVRSGTLLEEPVSSIASRRSSSRTRGLPLNPAEGKRGIAGKPPSQLEPVSLEFVAGGLQPAKHVTSTSNSFEFIAGTFNSRCRTLGQPSSPVTLTNREFLAGKYVPTECNYPRNSEFLSGRFVAGVASRAHEHLDPYRSLEFVAGKFVPIGRNRSVELLAGKLAFSKAVTPGREGLCPHRSLEFVAGTFVPANNYSQQREPIEFLGGRLVSKTSTPDDPSSKQMVTTSWMESIEYLAGGFILAGSQSINSLEFLAGKLVARKALEFLAGRFVSQRPTVFGARGTSTEFLAGRLVSVKGEVRGTTVPAIRTDRGPPAQVQEQEFMRSGLPTALHARTRASSTSTKVAFNSRPLPSIPVGSASASKRISSPSHTTLTSSSTVSIGRHVSIAPTLTTTPEIGSSIVQKDTGIAQARSLSSKPPSPVVPRKPDSLSKSSPPVVPRKADTSSKPPPAVPRRLESLVARRSRVFDTSPCE